MGPGHTAQSATDCTGIAQRVHSCECVGGHSPHPQATTKTRETVEVLERAGSSCAHRGGCMLRQRTQ